MANSSDPNAIAPYRFIDDSDENPIAVPEYHVVEFYPVMADYVELGRANARRYSAGQMGGKLLTVFVILNTVGIPAFLIYLDLFLPAAIVFGLDLAFLMFVMPAILRTDYRRYYDLIAPNLEKRPVSVELSVGGIRLSGDGNNAFYPWNHVWSLEETPTALSVTFGHGHAIAISKAGFASETAKTAFMGYAKQHINSASPARWN